jgi:hypothetical protein
VWNNLSEDLISAWNGAALLARWNPPRKGLSPFLDPSTSRMSHMDLIDRMKEIAARIAKQSAHIQTEEATKNAFIMPFLNSLGYDVFNPLEVIPEFTADVGCKKGEKVDYAIRKEDKIIMLIECKWCGTELDIAHASQLYRYFSTTESRFAILTNGLRYEFYSDIDESNKMDSKPFFVFDLLHFEEHQLGELKKFTKSAFSLEDILTTASALKYTGSIKRILEEQLKNPSEAYVRFFASQIYDGRLTQAVLTEFTRLVKEASSQFLNERINERLKSALAASEPKSIPENAETPMPEGENRENKNNGIVTTQDEIDAFNIIRAVLREQVDVKRVAMRDGKAYCAILLDDNNRKPVCRLHFNQNRKFVGFLKDKVEERFELSSPDELFSHAERIKAAVAAYDAPCPEG